MLRVGMRAQLDRASRSASAQMKSQFAGRAVVKVLWFLYFMQNAFGFAARRPASCPLVPATVGDLQRLSSAIDPDRVVPIHSSAPEQYSATFERVERHFDGEWWSV